MDINSFILNKKDSILVLNLNGITESQNIRFTELIINNNLQTILLKGHALKKYSKCPFCNRRSHQIRSKYIRIIQCLPVMQYSCIIELETRRFKCINNKCSHKIFSESFKDLVKRYGRVTTLLDKTLTKLLLEVSARRGSYLAKLMKIKRSTSTCLRTISKLNVPNKYELEHIGIDDWAFKKGCFYGTIIVDSLTGKAVNLINSRKKEAVAEHLRNYTHLKTVTRDRASAYAGAITKYNPRAAQIADKFHIIKNLGDVIYSIILKNHKEILSEQQTTLTPIIVKRHIDLQTQPIEIKQVMKNTFKQKQSFKAVKRLKSLNVSERKIAKVLKIHRLTVKKYSDYDKLPDIQISYRNNYLSYIDEIELFCNNKMRTQDIYLKLKDLGLKSCESAFYKWFKKSYPVYYTMAQDFQKKTELNLSKIETLSNSQFISPIKLSIYVSSKNFGINKKTGEVTKEYLIAHEMIQKSSILKNIKGFSDSFRKLMSTGTIKDLNIWMERCKKENYKQLHRFVNGLENDLEPVINALKYNFTNGLVEGNVNRLKTIKRGMYGRAGFELLKRKVCLSCYG